MLGDCRNQEKRNSASRTETEYRMVLSIQGKGGVDSWPGVSRFPCKHIDRRSIGLRTTRDARLRHVLCTYQRTLSAVSIDLPTLVTVVKSSSQTHRRPIDLACADFSKG